MGIPKSVRNKIRKGQLWKKRDTGQIIEIICRKSGTHWFTRKVGKNSGGRNSTHTITQYDIIKCYDLL